VDHEAQGLYRDRCNSFYPSAFAQHKPALSSGVPVQTSLAAPDLVLTRHFFAHLSALESQAAQLEAAGKSGAIYHTYYMKVLGFTPQQYAVVKSTAITTQQQTHDLDARAAALIQTFRTQLKGAGPNNRPVPPVELKTLQHDRDMATVAAASQLKKSLGPAAYEHLNFVIKAEFHKPSRSRRSFLRDIPETPRRLPWRALLCFGNSAIRP
jgi:hypothetical protein